MTISDFDLNLDFIFKITQISLPIIFVILICLDPWQGSIFLQKFNFVMSTLNILRRKATFWKILPKYRVSRHITGRPDILQAYYRHITGILQAYYRPSRHITGILQAVQAYYRPSRHITGILQAVQAYYRHITGRPGILQAYYRPSRHITGILQAVQA